MTIISEQTEESPTPMPIALDDIKNIVTKKKK
jgi:hypothetical protein